MVSARPKGKREYVLGYRHAYDKGEGKLEIEQLQDMVVAAHSAFRRLSRNRDAYIPILGIDAVSFDGALYKGMDATRRLASVIPSVSGVAGMGTALADTGASEPPIMDALEAIHHTWRLHYLTTYAYTADDKAASPVSAEAVGLSKDALDAAAALFDRIGGLERALVLANRQFGTVDDPVVSNWGFITTPETVREAMRRLGDSSPA